MDGGDGVAPSEADEKLFMSELSKHVCVKEWWSVLETKVKTLR